MSRRLTNETRQNPYESSAKPLGEFEMLLSEFEILIGEFVGAYAMKGQKTKFLQKTLRTLRNLNTFA